MTMCLYQVVSNYCTGCMRDALPLHFCVVFEDSGPPSELPR